MVIAGVLVAILSRHRWRLAGLCALPALLAAAPRHPAVPLAIAPGPVWVEGRVHDVVRAPLTGRNYVELAPDLRIAFPGEIELLPGTQ